MKYRSIGSAQEIIKKDYSKEILFTKEDFENNGHLLQIVTIPPHTKQRAHVHRTQTEVFYILEGEASIFMNSKEFISHSGDSFICEPGDKHFLWNKTGTIFKLVVFKINYPNNSEEDTEWVEGNI